MEICCENCEHSALDGFEHPCNICDACDTHCEFVPKQTVTLESIDRKLNLIMAHLGIKEEEQ